MRKKLALLLAAILFLSVPNIITLAADNVVTNFDEFMEAFNSSNTITIGGTVEIPNGTVINMNNKQIKRHNDFTDSMFVLLPGDAITVLAFAKYDGNDTFSGNFITVFSDASFPGLTVQNHRSIHNGGVVHVVEGNTNIDYAYFMNNIAVTSGSGIIAIEPSATLTINESDFYSNVGMDGIINNRGNLFITGSSAQSTSFSGNISQGRGGVLSNIGGYVQINEFVEFSQNVARYEASDIYNEGILNLNLDNFYYDFVDNRLSAENYTALQATEIFDNQPTSLVHINFIDFYISALKRMPDPIEPPLIITPSPEPPIEPTESPLPSDIPPSPTPEVIVSETPQPVTPSPEPTETQLPVMPSPVPSEEIPTTEEPTETPMPQESEKPNDNNNDEDTATQEEIIPSPIPILDDGCEEQIQPSASPEPSELPNEPEQIITTPTPNEDDSDNDDDDTEKPKAIRKPTSTPHPTQSLRYAYTLPTLPTWEPIENVPLENSLSDIPTDESTDSDLPIPKDDDIIIEGTAPPPYDIIELHFIIGLNGYTKNGVLSKMDVTPFISTDNRTMIPLYIVAEAFGVSTNWIAESQTVQIIKDDYILNIKIGEPLPSGGTATIIDNRTFIPLRFSEFLGAVIDWDEQKQSITIRYTSP